jgi:long-chain acyl-CoA synthetase
VDAASLDAGYGPQDVLGWDSMAHMNFVIALEEAFGLEFTPREVMSIDRLDKAVSIVLQR